MEDFVLTHAGFEEELEDVAFAVVGQRGVGAAGGFVAEEFEELLFVGEEPSQGALRPGDLIPLGTVTKQMK